MINGLLGFILLIGLTAFPHTTAAREWDVDMYGTYVTTFSLADTIAAASSGDIISIWPGVTRDAVQPNSDPATVSTQPFRYPHPYPCMATSCNGTISSCPVTSYPIGAGTIMVPILVDKPLTIRSKCQNVKTTLSATTKSALSSEYQQSHLCTLFVISSSNITITNLRMTTANCELSLIASVSPRSAIRINAPTSNILISSNAINGTMRAIEISPYDRSPICTSTTYNGCSDTNVICPGDFAAVSAISVTSNSFENILSSVISIYRITGVVSFTSNSMTKLSTSTVHYVYANPTNFTLTATGNSGTTVRVVNGYLFETAYDYFCMGAMFPTGITSESCDLNLNLGIVITAIVLPVSFTIAFIIWMCGVIPTRERRLRRANQGYVQPQMQ